MSDPLAHNAAAWDKQAAGGGRWSVPVTAEEVARARRGDFTTVLTPRKPVPKEWYGPLAGRAVLALASAGGQQGPLLAAAGASVVVLDASPVQLERDRAVAARDRLDLRTELGDMKDLSRFADASFDMVYHACSNCFVPAVRPVWKEAARVLRPGGRLLAGFCLPHWFLVDEKKDEAGVVDVRFSIPYSDEAQLRPEELRRKLDAKEPLHWGHTLEDQLGGQTDAGLLIAGFYEDGWEPGVSALSDRIACFAATLALKR